MKKFLAILLAALMLFSLTACGGDKDSVAAADPNLGVYNGVSVVTLGMEMDYVVSTESGPYCRKEG